MYKIVNKILLDIPYISKPFKAYCLAMGKKHGTRYQQDSQ